MELDAKGFAEGATLDTDVCIIGAGPAGLVLASELVGHRCDLVVLESGANSPEAEVLALNDGENTGDVYAGLALTRHRHMGGTSQLWNTNVGGSPGAKFVPLDASDFVAWPFGLEELRADYVRAQWLCGLGPFAYDATDWSIKGCEPWPNLGSELVSRVYQLGPRDAPLDPLRASLVRATNVRVCVHATATRLHLDARTRAVQRIDVSTPGGPSWSVRAKRVVLAAGAVENARLLLLSDIDSSWLGRGFMEHPRDRAISLTPHSRDLYGRSAFYDEWRARDGTHLVGRLALSDASLVDRDAMNASGTLIPRLSAAVHGVRAITPSFAAGWLPAEAHGWSRQRGASLAFDGFTVLLNLEQSPHPDNRITLSTRRDSLGSPLPTLHWTWRADDHERLVRLRALVASALAGIGKVRIDAAARPDPNAHHHAGTTRMHDDPSLGVTDRHGRVHGTDNLYVAGASLFPTAGFANPVLTIVALAVRLARYLRSG